MEEILLHYEPDELQRWRKGDRSLVPERLFRFKGPGLANGYGYAEFVVGRCLEEQGYEVITNEFGLIGNTSKYGKNNLRIESALGEEGYNRLRRSIKVIRDSGLWVEQPDICAISPTVFFAEAKRNGDRLRKPQKRFAALASALLHVPFKVYKVLPTGTNYQTSRIELREKLPAECLR